jgi:hypothetical protein
VIGGIRVISLQSPLRQKCFSLGRVILHPVDHLSRHAGGLRNRARARVLSEHVPDDVKLGPIEARLAASVAVRLIGDSMGYAGPLGLFVDPSARGSYDGGLRVSGGLLQTVLRETTVRPLTGRDRRRCIYRRLLT